MAKINYYLLIPDIICFALENSLYSSSEVLHHKQCRPLPAHRYLFYHIHTKKVQSTVSQMIDVISSILRASLNLEVRCLSRSSSEFARTDFNR